MLGDYVFDRCGIYHLIELFSELLEILIYAAAVSEAARHGELRISSRDDYGFREHAAAPVSDGRQLADSAGKEYELRLGAGDVLLHIFERRDEDFTPRATSQL